MTGVPRTPPAVLFTLPFQTIRVLPPDGIRMR